MAVAETRVELTLLDDDLAAKDRHARPGGDFVTLPWGVIGLVQILFADDAARARVEQHDVGIRAYRQRPFARIEPHDLRRVCRGEADKIPKAVAALLDHVRQMETVIAIARAGPFPLTV